MSSDRDTYKYQFVGPDQRIKHSGITNDLERHERELRREYGQGNIPSSRAQDDPRSRPRMGEEQTHRGPVGPLTGGTETNGRDDARGGVRVLQQAREHGAAGACPPT